ncbi:cytochrome c-type biogenesis protein [Notoacmeibacter ruber]|uniref:Cytochrome c-type biogenesis protein n=1 Tax=Notoacmeibacter ruber TaxID=2670375 RepID=A0A3L7J9V6_9HYPH|nr:cytochrome c-type biogenesis protein [Notoacmeibacter ruber]RLQ87537.1 cytochrome c-type biogenesis protein CcmH [Notoacmeibacter ruber]
MKHFLLALMLGLGLGITPASAVQPDEMLDDPALESRAREISSGLRCLVCQNQSIDDSDAEIARDLRILVRDRLKEGESDEEVVDYIVSRYGQFVLLKPVFSPTTVLLWATPLLVLVGGGAFLFLRRPRRTVTASEEPLAAPLTAEEEARLNGVLSEDRER